MNRLSNYYRALLLFLITAFFSSGAYAQQCQFIIKSGSLEGCIPSNFSFEVTHSTGKTVTQVKWDFGNGNTTITNGTTTPFAYNNRGSFTPSAEITFDDGTKCNASFGQQIKVYGNPVPNMILPSGTGNNGSIQCYQKNGVKNKFCFTDNSQPGPDGNPIVKWVWNFGDGDTASTDVDPSFKNPCHSYEAPGTYTITLQITDSKGCKAQQTRNLSIVVLPDIKPKFAINGNPACTQTSYTFNNTTDTNGILLKSFYWDFGDGSPVDSVNWSPTHTYTANGSFTVTLRIVNRLGCEGVVTGKASNIVAQLDLDFPDSVCFSGNNVPFEAKEIPGAAFWQWNFDDPPSGNENVKAFDWKPTHAFTAPGNYNVRFQVVHPVCGVFDTCFVVHIKGPQARINLPPPPAFPANNIVSGKRMARQELVDLYTAAQSGSNCSPTSIDYAVWSTPTNKNVTEYEYCNAVVTKEVFAEVAYCDGDTQVYLDSIFLTPTNVVNKVVKDSFETVQTWTVNQPYPWIADPNIKLYYPSSGTFNWQNMHDTNNFTCKLPNLVRFTNNSIKYRLYKAIDDDPARNYEYTDINTGAWRDKCKYTNFPFASDSMEYFWKFNDPNGKPCTSTVSNPDWDCNFSTLVAPYHYYRGPTTPASGCQSVNFRVEDKKINCADSTSFMLRQGPPKSSYTRKSDHPNGYCNMNWDMQLYLPPGNANTNSPPLRGFRLANQPLPCAGSDYHYRINFEETLPNCGAQNYWLIFDKEEARRWFIRNGGDSVCFDNGTQVPWDGAGNDNDYPTGAPKSTWEGLPWLGEYWYQLGEEGCKTVGVKLQVGECTDVFWYEDYICFKRLLPDFLMYREDTTIVLDGFGNPNDTVYTNTFVDDSRNRQGHVCHADPLNPGFVLRINPRDQTQPVITNFYTRINRRSFPNGDYYYDKPFWPDSATLNPFADPIDSVSAREDYYYVPDDSLLYIEQKDGNGNVIGNILLFNFPVSGDELDDLNTQGFTTIDNNGFLGRKVNFYCEPNIILKTFQQPLTIKRETPILNLFDTASKRRDIIGDSAYNKNTYNAQTAHDTMLFHIPYPGFYTITSQIQNLDGCVQIGQYHLIYGHFARFQLKTGFDSIICVGDEVRFDYRVSYWSTDCDIIPGQGPPDGCTTDDIGRHNEPYSQNPVVFAHPFQPWNVPDPVIYRQNLNPDFVPTAQFQKELIDWNFGDGTGWQKFVPGQPVYHTYNKPGVYDVTMRTTDEYGCTIYTVRRNFIKVIGLSPDFVVRPLRDTLTFCAPRDITFKDLTVLDGSETNRKGYFEYKDRVVKNGKIVDTVYAIDSIIAWTWDPGDGRPAVTRTQTDSVIFNYRENGVYTINLKIKTGNQPQSCESEITRTNYIKIDGPIPKFEIGDTAGCAPFTTNITNLNTQYFDYQWYTGEGGNIVKSGRGVENIPLTYNNPGRYRIYVLIQDSVYNSIDDRWEICTKTWPEEDDTIQFWVEVFPHPPIEIKAKELVCPKEIVQFTASTEKDAYVKYDWDFGDGETASGSDSVVSHAYTTPGFYWVHVTGTTDNDCTEKDSFQIEVDSVLSDFAIDSTFAKLGKFSFLNTSDGGVKYVWDFGDGTTKEVTDTLPITHQYNAQKFAFKVCLITFSRAGCTDTACYDVDFSRLYEPFNVFTPNNDGKNDVFDPAIEGETEYELEIYNRWGERVFVSEDKENDWNGKVNNTGAECPEGTYYYVWKFKLIGGVEKMEKGTVTLLR